MASRPVFFPVLSGAPGVRMEQVQFVWSPGLAPSQKRKNVEALHQAVGNRFPGQAPLEASSKSPTRLGAALSAFSLGLRSVRSGAHVCVESLYQCSKVFADAGPFPHGYGLPAMEARTLVASHSGQPLTGFCLHGVPWPLTPARAFYDWLYCQALHRNPQLVAALSAYACFTDIEFNPARSVNCQAYAIALYRSLAVCGALREALSGKDAFLRLHPQGADNGPSPVKPRRPPRRARRPAPSTKSRAAPAAPQPAPLTLFDQALPDNGQNP